MKAMDRIRELAHEKLSDSNGNVNKAKLSRRVGVAAATVCRFMIGTQDSPVMAEWLANEYGGEFPELYKQYLAERLADKQPQMKFARETNKRDFPPPSNFVPMPEPAIETHNLADLSALPRNLQRFCGYLGAVA